MVTDSDPSPGSPSPRTLDRVLAVGEPSSWPALIRTLMAEGCEVVVAEDAPAARKALAKGTYLFALLHARGGDDLALLRALREQARETRMVIVSTSLASESVVEAMRLGACDYVTAPVPSAAINAVLHRAREQDALRHHGPVKALQVLAPGLVHELRNPLSGILASSQMLARFLPSEGTAREYLDIIQEEARRLGGFLTRLAELGRLQTAESRGAGMLDLHAILRRLFDEMRGTFQAYRVHLVCRCAAEVPEVPGDSGRVTQGCAELVHNALTAMPQGGTLTVSTSRLHSSNSQLVDSSRRADQLTTRPIDDSTEWVEMEFADTGMGMTEEVRRRAFEPFFSTRPRALGLGLPLVQAIMLAQGGAIRIESRPGAGTQVILTFPVTG